ncbi:MAG: formate/nitrite transporter family protein [Oscillospiraceae bacterium]|jgi:nitrite transporter NirC|nr:formate/nitrite transporter family protein [Oscillospiraceae bacterium]
MREYVSGVLAGILVGIGGAICISCDNRYLGSIFFSIALLFICIRGYSLFTGKVGFIIDEFSAKKLFNLFYCLLGNITGAIISGTVIKFSFINLHQISLVSCTGKLEQSALQTFIRAAFCGILMYLAVVVYKENKSKIGILFSVPVFILSGYEHSIANMFYFTLSGIFSTQLILYILITVIGNTSGGILFAYLSKYAKGEK